MRTNIVMLAMLAGLGLSSFGTVAVAKNLSCISGISPSEQRLLRDCEPEPQEFYTVIEVVNEAPPPSTPPGFTAARGRGQGGPRPRARQGSRRARRRRPRPPPRSR